MPTPTSIGRRHLLAAAAGAAAGLSEGDLTCSCDDAVEAGAPLKARTGACLTGAARIAGANELGIDWRIALTLMKPALGTLGLITFIGSWTNVMNPLNGPCVAENCALPPALRSLFSTTSTEWGALMAGSAIATLPLLVLFVVSSRQLIAGLTAGAVK